MASPLPIVLPLRRGVLERRDRWPQWVGQALRRCRGDTGRAVHDFLFKNDEADFALALLEKKSQLWLFRSNQRRACGDFVVVDVSNPSPVRRPAYVLDLKQNAPLREGGGGAGAQLRNAQAAVDALASGARVLAPGTTARLLTGDASAMLAFFGA